MHSSYIDKVKATVYHLHFGDFGGRPLNVIYFVLGVMGCIVIISGIMIWLVARDKPNIPKHKRVFNFWTANVFLAACIHAASNGDHNDRTVVSERWSSGNLSLVFLLLAGTGHLFHCETKHSDNDERNHPLVGDDMFSIALLDGIVRGNWIWNSYARQAYDILFIDLLFFLWR